MLRFLIADVRRLANDPYGLAKIAQDAGLLYVAQIAYARSAELRLRSDEEVLTREATRGDHLYAEQ